MSGASPSEDAAKGWFGQVAAVYRASRKREDIFWNVYIARPLAAVVVMLLRPLPITPNQVTFLGVGVFFGTAALLIGWRDPMGLLAAAVVLELSYLLDCADGQLARLKGQTSDIGGYLDFLVDEIKALLLVGSCCVRQWLVYDDVRWLVLGLGGVFLVAAGTSLTTFVRRPEYAGVEQKPGLPVVPKRPSGGIATIVWAVNRGARFFVHYPSWFLLVALADWLTPLDGVLWFLAIYLSMYVLYVGRTSLAVLLRLGSPRFYRS